MTKITKRQILKWKLYNIKNSLIDKIKSYFGIPIFLEDTKDPEFLVCRKSEKYSIDYWEDRKNRDI